MPDSEETSTTQTGGWNRNTGWTRSDGKTSGTRIGTGSQVSTSSPVLSGLQRTAMNTGIYNLMNRANRSGNFGQATVDARRFSSNLTSPRVGQAAAAYQNMATGRAGNQQIRIADSLSSMGQGNAAQRTALANLDPIASGSQVLDNPYFQPALQDQLDRVARMTKSEVAGSGRYGSGAHTGVMTDRLGAASTSALANQYAQDRALQVQALGMQGNLGTQLAGQDFTQAGMRMGARDNRNALMQTGAAGLADIGARETALAASLPGAVQAYRINPVNTLFNMGASVPYGTTGTVNTDNRDENTVTQTNNGLSGSYSTYGGSTTGTTPTSPFANGLGGFLGGSQIANGLGFDPLIGGGLGFLGGLFG